MARSAVLIDVRRAIFPGAKDELAAIELASGRKIWSRAPEGWPSLSGAALQIRRDGAHLLVIVERNYGCEFERWDIETGALMHRPILVGRERVDLAATALASDAYLFVSHSGAVAVERSTGKLRWEFPLPRAGTENWRACATRTNLVLYPTRRCRGPT